MKITMTKELVELVQNHYKKNIHRKLFKSGISKELLKNLGVDTSVKLFEMGNLRVKKDFFDGNYYPQLIDVNKDMNGLAFSENKVFMKKLNGIYENSKQKKLISWDDLSSLNIMLTKSSHIIGNYKLTDSGVFEEYSISIYDKLKDTTGKYPDGQINYDKVYNALLEYQGQLSNVKAITLNKEILFNDDLFEFFNKRFANVTKFSDTNGIPDMILGVNKQCVMELKIGNKLDSTLCDKTIGQLLRYQDMYHNTEVSREFWLILLGNEEKLSENQDISRLKRITERLKFRFHIIDVEI